MKIMSVDYGDSRTGLAMCDKSEILASPLYTINMKDFDRCVEMVAQAAQENVFDYVEGKSQTKGERVTESSRNFVGDCLAFVREFVEKEREQ